MAMPELPRAELLGEALETILDEIKLSCEAWEDGERIMCFNGSPIGATVRDAEVGRWWPELKPALAQFLARRIIEVTINRQFEPRFSSARESGVK
jgi:hypothetical protein